MDRSEKSRRKFLASLAKSWIVHCILQICDKTEKEWWWRVGGGLVATSDAESPYFGWGAVQICQSFCAHHFT